MTRAEPLHHRLVEVLLRLQAEGSPAALGDVDEIARRALRRWLRTGLFDGERATRDRRLEDLALGLSESFPQHPLPPFSEYRYLAAELGEVLLDAA
ncbi:MAG TPA: hypothetical protein VNT23_02305 [Gaiellaceae bacterium]|nr:hypothetical protein [Gaiellaceae bacterium]